MEEDAWNGFATFVGTDVDIIESECNTDPVVAYLSGTILLPSRPPKHKYFLLFFTTSGVRPFCVLSLRQSQSYQVLAPRFPHHAICLSVSDSSPPHNREQPNTATQAVFMEQWTPLLLAYARHRGLFVLWIEDAKVSGGEWRSCRIRGSIVGPSHPFIYCSSPGVPLPHLGDLSFWFVSLFGNSKR